MSSHKSNESSRKMNSVREPSLEESIRELEYRLSKRTFVKAISPCVAKHIVRLVEHVKSVRDKAEKSLEILDNSLLLLYNIEHNVKEVIRSLIKIVTQEYKADLAELYPYLPSSTRKLIEMFVKEVELGGVERAEIRLDSEINILFNRLYEQMRKLREVLQELSGMYISKKKT